MSEKGDLDAAILQYQKALEYQKPLAQRKDAQPQWQLSCAGSYNNLAAALREKGDLDAATVMHQKALDYQKPLAQRKDAQPQWQFDCARTHHNLAVTLRDKGELGNALANISQATSSLRQSDYQNLQKSLLLIKCEALSLQTVQPDSGVPESDRLRKVIDRALETLHRYGGTTVRAGRLAYNHEKDLNTALRVLLPLYFQALIREGKTGLLPDAVNILQCRQLMNDLELQTRQDKVSGGDAASSHETLRESISEFRKIRQKRESTQTHYESLINQLPVQLPTNPDERQQGLKAQADRLKPGLTGLIKKESTLRRQIASIPGYEYVDAGHLPLPADKVQSALGERLVLVIPVLLEGVSGLVIITRETVSWENHDLQPLVGTSGALSQAIERYASNPGELHRRDLQATQVAFAETVSAFWEIAKQAVSLKLPDCDEYLLVTTSELQKVPLCSLTALPITRLPSLAHVLMRRKTKGANPESDAAGDTVATMAWEGNVVAGQTPHRRIHGTYAEQDYLATQWEKAGAKVIKPASLSELENAVLTRIFISCHGHFAELQALRGLSPQQLNLADGEYASSADAWRFQANEVYISACVVANSVEAEGQVLGLPSALMQSGVSTVVCSFYSLYSLMAPVMQYYVTRAMVKAIDQGAPISLKQAVTAARKNMALMETDTQMHTQLLSHYRDALKDRLAAWVATQNGNPFTWTSLSVRFASDTGEQLLKSMLAPFLNEVAFTRLNRRCLAAYTSHCQAFATATSEARNQHIDDTTTLMHKAIDEALATPENLRNPYNDPDIQALIDITTTGMEVFG